MSVIGKFRRFLLAAAMYAATVPASAADVGVSISVGEPGFYGRLDIGGYPPPYLVYPQPVVIHRPPVMYAPIYLHVPRGHARHWGHYCGRYGACGRPAYFVQDRWYDEVYVPRYRERHWRGRGGEHDGHWRG